MKHPIPDAALDDRHAYVGKTGSGKTYGAGTVVERVLKSGRRNIIIDPLGVWWGLRLMADGKTPSPFEIVIFGGPHGDVPITPNAGALVGETVALMRESSIIDLSEFETDAAERKFMLPFLEAVYRKSAGEPTHVWFDEADLFAPERIMDKTGDATRLHHVMQTIVRRGRIRGLASSLITQRPAALSKQVLSQVDGLIAFKLVTPTDKKAIGQWIEGQASKADAKAILDRLPEKRKGEAVVWLPSHDILIDTSFPEKITYDSSRSPKPGEKRKAVSLKPLDVAAVREKMATVEAEVKANDPKALKAEIAALHKKISDGFSTASRVGNIEVERQKATDHALEQAILTFEGVRMEAISRLTGLSGALREVIDDISKPLAAAIKAIGKPLASPPARPAPPRPQPSVHVLRPSPAKVPRSNGADSSLPVGERAILVALAVRPNGATRQALTVLTGYRRSTRDAYLLRLANRGFVVEAGGRMRALGDGIAALGEFEPLPTGAALIEHWLRELPQGEAAIFDRLVKVYPAAVSRDDLTEATGYQRSTRDAYLLRLAAKELITRQGSDIVASENLFT